MLQNTDQRGDEDDRAENLQEEERQTFVVHFTEDKVGPFIGESEQFFEHFGEAFYEAETYVGVQEEPRK